MAESNGSSLIETLYAKELLIVKGRDERKKKLQQVLYVLFLLKNSLFNSSFRTLLGALLPLNNTYAGFNHSKKNYFLLIFVIKKKKK